MKALFVHQNCPGQFRHLAPYLVKECGADVGFVTQRGKPSIPGIQKFEYAPHRGVTEKIHPYLASTEAAVLNGQAVARLAYGLADNGYRPDVIIGNPGWGETLYLKDVWPDVPLILLTEFFYRGRGTDVGFDPEFDLGRDAELRARTRSAPHLLAIEAADAAYAPTNWQRDQFPSVFRDRIRVIHDGIDCDRVRPDPDARFELPSGKTLSRSDEVLTYVARNLEPYRGFHTFMRALPRVLDARPEAQVVIVGGDSVSYGRRPNEAASWREAMLDEVGLLPERVHFTGRLPYSDYLHLLQVSSVHVYLTYPFVLSWSMLEAMASGCLIVGSRTAPVEEVIEEGVNGRLVDFFDVDGVATGVSEALRNRQGLEKVREAARRTVVERFALTDCLAAQHALIDEVLVRSR